jgi:hypothetical protein
VLNRLSGSGNQPLMTRGEAAPSGKPAPQPEEGDAGDRLERHLMGAGGEPKPLERLAPLDKRRGTAVFYAEEADGGGVSVGLLRPKRQ